MIAQLDRIAANPRITESRYQRAKRAQIQYAENILNSKGGSNAYSKGFEQARNYKATRRTYMGLNGG
ncbi:hypothetical protein [Phocaeicola coprocola]|uniref:hypothetical protein n=1 Tax=Phocaeicola coprocola TaxID=310298 RepID=UPI003AF14E42